eukprot:CAMPEP_0177723426 /NCGR_PEP_ID=MMETSP0484_2-20121128/18205_1 /TAXON_ID=354590 /ORGANISM="Rhodomonas lens, Strain RHODO" /LENGTH=43 /DNA_ID= /DNA_START= /DNA_END= /DNA_ORIENTATION=
MPEHASFGAKRRLRNVVADCVRVERGVAEDARLEEEEEEEEEE